VVGLVKHRHPHPAQVAVALGDEVVEAPGRRHDDVGPPPQRGHLRPLRHAAVDGRAAQPHGSCQRRDRARHLGGQFAGGHEDQPPGSARFRPVVLVRQGSGQRDGKGDGLAAPRLGAPEHVAPRERVGQCGGLDRERHGGPHRHERLLQGGRDTERGERLRRSDLLAAADGRLDRPWAARMEARTRVSARAYARRCSEQLVEFLSRMRAVDAVATRSSSRNPRPLVCGRTAGRPNALVAGTKLHDSALSRHRRDVAPRPSTLRQSTLSCRSSAALASS